jgi:hypothetical protein
MLALAIAITTGVITTIMMAADGIHVRAAGRAAIRALTEHQLAHAEEMKGKESPARGAAPISSTDQGGGKRRGEDMFPANSPLPSLERP